IISHSSNSDISQNSSLFNFGNTIIGTDTPPRLNPHLVPFITSSSEIPKNSGPIRFTESNPLIISSSSDSNFQTAGSASNFGASLISSIRRRGMI
ncbi:hypothetical protein GIB67_002483, partial [Kingdonia uniflora]